MKAAQIAAYRQVRFTEAATPQIRDGCALIRIKVVSICGTDLRYFLSQDSAKYPLAPGMPVHECAGIVEESRTSAVRRGDRVIVTPTAMSGLLEFVVEPPTRLVRLPHTRELAEWVMCQHLGTVLYATERLGRMRGRRVAIVGQGAIGLAFTRIAAMQGAAQIVAIDKLLYRTQYATTLGATHTVVATGASQVERDVIALTDGGADLTVDAVGDPETILQTIGLTRPLGTVNFFGNSGRPVGQWPHELAYAKNLTFVYTAAAYVPGGALQRAIERAVRLVRSGRWDLSALVTHHFPIEDIQEAFDMYADKRNNIIKPVVVW